MSPLHIILGLGLMIHVGVIGGSQVSEELEGMAEEVGRLIARRGGRLICDGLGGVMRAAAKGAKSAGGITVGVLPGNSRDEANSYIDVPLATGMGLARNAIIVRSSDVLIAIDGGYGTLSEIAYAFQLGVPVVGLRTWDIEGITVTVNPEEAVEKAMSMAESLKARIG